MARGVITALVYYSEDASLALSLSLSRSLAFGSRTAMDWMLTFTQEEEEAVTLNFMGFNHFFLLVLDLFDVL